MHGDSYIITFHIYRIHAKFNGTNFLKFLKCINKFNLTTAYGLKVKKYPTLYVTKNEYFISKIRT